jgi:hypothetical protein
MAQAWPTRGGNPFADHVDSITKYVVASQPVDTTAWDPAVVIAASTGTAELLDRQLRDRQLHRGRAAAGNPERSQSIDCSCSSASCADGAAPRNGRPPPTQLIGTVATVARSVTTQM